MCNDRATTKDKTRKTAVLPGFWNIEQGSGGFDVLATAAIVWRSCLPKIYGFIIAVIKILWDRTLPNVVHDSMAMHSRIQHD